MKFRIKSLLAGLGLAVAGLAVSAPASAQFYERGYGGYDRGYDRYDRYDRSDRYDRRAYQRDRLEQQKRAVRAQREAQKQAIRSGRVYGNQGYAGPGVQRGRGGPIYGAPNAPGPGGGSYVVPGQGQTFAQP